MPKEPLTKWSGGEYHQLNGRSQDQTHKGLDAIPDIAAALNRVSSRLDIIDRRAEQHEVHEYEAQPEPEISFCKTKIADLALIFFTYCLVVVGYFTIRRGEKNVRDLERAIMLGGPTMVEQIPAGPNVFTSGISENRAFFKMGVQNYGRTPGLLKKYFVQFSTAEPLGTVAEYGVGETYACDIGIYPTAHVQGFRADPFWSDLTGVQYCFGWLEYEDMFRKTHVSRFCVRVQPGTQRMDGAGSAAYNEWD